MLIIWQHLRIEVPEDWEMLLFGRDPAAGRCTFADRYQHRLELNWQKVSGRPDFERMLGDYRGELQKDPDSEEVATVRQGGWQGLAARTKGVLTSRFGCYLEGEGCLVELVFVWPEGRDERLERCVLSSVREEPVDAEGCRRWRAFGMEMRPREGLELKSCVAQPGNAKMVFGDAKDALREEQFERLGMVPEWLREPVRTWLRRRVPLRMSVRGITTERVEGREVEVIRGDRPATGAQRLLGRRVPYETRAWIEPADGRLYCCTVSGDPDGCAGRLRGAEPGNGGRP